MRPQIDRAELHQRMRRLSAGEQAAAPNIHSAPGNRQITAVRVQFHRRLSRDEPKESSVSNEMIQRAGSREIDASCKHQQNTDCNEQLRPTTHTPETFE